MHRKIDQRQERRPHTSVIKQYEAGNACGKSESKVQFLRRPRSDSHNKCFLSGASVVVYVAVVVHHEQGVYHKPACHDVHTTS